MTPDTPKWILSKQEQTALYTFSFPVCCAFLAIYTPGALFKLARTCQIAYSNVKQWKSKAFLINNYLQEYFDHLLWFRNLQAQMDTIISGSNVLQFLDCTHFKGSDMDLYVHSVHVQDIGIYLMKVEGYLYAGKSSLFPSRPSSTSSTDIFTIDQLSVDLA